MSFSPTRADGPALRDPDLFTWIADIPRIGARHHPERTAILTDRIKDMIVSGGENVYPAEVEEAVRQHPAVLDVAVIGLPDRRWGEAVAAIVELRPGVEVGADELCAFVRTRIAGYKSPKHVRFVEVLPRTASGKVRRGELRQRFG